MNQVYNLLRCPFSKQQFRELSQIKLESLLGYFGSWETAIKEAGLSKKFDDLREVSKEVNSFDSDEEIKKRWKTQKEELLRKAENRKITFSLIRTRRVRLQ